MSANPVILSDTDAYKPRWVTCHKHDYETLEVYLPSLSAWTAPNGCPGCKAEAETGQRQPRKGQTAGEFRLELAQIPARFEGKRLQDFSAKTFRPALETVKNFLPTESLLILGPIASGKTSFSCALLRELLAQPWALELSPDVGRYIATPDLMDTLWRESRAYYSDQIAETLKEEFGKIAVLVIDDVQEIHTAEELAWLQRLLGFRQKKATIICGGPDLETLEAVLGSRTLNQLRGWKQISLGAKESV